jgi:peptidoglycan/LPS O-acetylase OafA/YrhL
MLSDLDFRSNAIGFLRLFFAAVVVWYHVGLGGFSPGPLPSGFLAVAGFFVLSGLLITRSFEKIDNAGRFLWHRFLRIMPGFWVCLVAVALLFAPLAFLHEYGTLAGFFTQRPSPLGYITQNVGLQINQGTIGTLLGRLPETKFLNGSLWTLIWECLSYLTVVAIGLAGFFKRWRWLNIVLLVASYIAASALISKSNPATMPIIYVALELGALFWCGGCAYLYRDRIPMRSWLAVLCVIGVVATAKTTIAPFFVIPCMAYATLYAAMALPIRNFDRRFDFSYGLYIYAYPVQQLLALYGLSRFGVAGYFALSFCIALTLAAASWFAVERPFLSFKNYGLKRDGLAREIMGDELTLREHGAT